MSDVLRSARSPWLATPLIAIPAFVALFSLSLMIELGAWMRTTFLLLAAVTLVVMFVRMATRSRILPTLVGLVAAVLLFIPAYVRDDAGHAFLLPTPTAIRTLLSTFKDGMRAANEAAPPATVGRTFAALITASILGLFLLGEHVAVSYRAVASAGLILFAPWIPAVVLSHRVSTAALLVGLAAWLGAMTLARKNAPIERGISLGSAGAATLATIGMALLVIPAALGGAGWGAIPRLNTPDLFNAPTRLNLDLDLRSSLTTNSQAPVLVYLSTGARPDAFRIYTLTNFNGSSWDYDPPKPTNRPVSTGLLWPEDVEGWTAADKVRVDVSVLSLVSHSLPLPTTPRTVQVTGDWTYDPPSDSVIAASESTSNLRYSFVADISYHTAAALRATESLLTSDPSLDATDPIYLEIPPSIDLAGIRSVADGLTSTKTTRYDKALAIQNYLRNPSIFTYTTAVDPSPGDAVSAFLKSKQGYCLQFATTMVMLLRSEGIPSRLGYGFLPGDYDGSNGYVVRGRDAHVWPEVYFPGHGWVRFEPTPSIQTGAPPKWADPYSTVLPVPQAVLDGGAYPTGPQQPQTGPGSGPGTTDAAPATPWWVFGGIAALLIAGVLGGWAVWRRRSISIARALHGPESAWQRLADGLGDLAWPLSATPLEATAHVLRGLRRVEGGAPSAEGSEALLALGRAVSDHRYAPSGTSIAQEQLESWTDEVLAEAEAAKGTATGRPARVGARSAPQADS